MSREVHVRFREGAGVRLPRATRLSITGRAQAFLEDEVRPLGAQFLAARGLALSQTKTRVTHMEDGCDVLGTHGRTYRGQLFCTPAKQHVQAFLDTIRGIVKRHKQALTGTLIRPLKPVIRGWAPYHQPGASTRTLAQVDHHLLTLLWQWARRSHPQPSRPWMRDQYVRSEDGNQWVFWGHITRAKGTRQEVRLFRASSVPIRRPTTIIGEANAYDPQWEPYFEARWGLRMAHHLQGRRPLLRLGKEPDGLGAGCHQRITKLTGWHSHHLVWRTPGGADRAENRVLLHPNGHAQVHSHGLTGVNLRPQSGVGKA